MNKMSEIYDNKENVPFEEHNREEDEENGGEEDVYTVYDSTKFISGPFLSETCTMPENILEFHFSFGYNCRKFFNLINPDTKNLIFTSGNFINILNVETKQLKFRRTALGGGVGSLKLNPNPNFPYLTIAENSYKDQQALIIIYEWPEFKIIRALKGGASYCYNDIDYSSDGILLASQSGQPDNLITVWKWRESTIILRTKSHINDVYKIQFSNYNRGQLTTCGESHIKFWHIERTFTGVKFYDNIGKFDKISPTDIIGVLSMADGTILSGCSWGNILLWEGDTTKLEIYQNNNKTCHKLPIIQFYYNEKNNELWTISMDGHIKFWWYRTIEQTETLIDTKQIIEIEPNYDFSIPNVVFMCLTKRHTNNEDDSTYFAQDGNGGIWLLDLTKEMSIQTPPEQLYECHGGRIMDIAPCPWGPYLISIGEDGKLILYQYIEKLKIFHHQFPSNAICIIWFNSNLSTTGDELILGFDDGGLRICILTILDDNTTRLILVQILKPHNGPITKIIINKDDTILISASEDSTIFIFQIIYENYPKLIPIGFVSLPNPATYLMWHNFNNNTIIIGCLHGEIIEIEITEEIINIKNKKRVSYYLNDLKLNINKFTSCKSQIRRNQQISDIRERRIEELKRRNPNFDSYSDIEISINEEDLEALYIPEIPNKILWMQIISNKNDNTIVLSMSGYDGGYLYQYKIDEITQEPYKYHPIPDADDSEIYSFVYNYNKKYLIFAMQHGEIRINKLNNLNLNDLSDYWQLSLHDNINNYIPKICFSCDEHYIFTCGYDGNLFSLTFNPDDSDYIPEEFIKKIQPREFYPKQIEDKSLYNSLTIEEYSLKAELDRITRLMDNKKLLCEKIENLTERYLNLKERNLRLPQNLIFSLAELVIDKRISDYIDKKFEQERESIKGHMAYDLEKSQVRVRKLKEHLVDCLDLYPISVKAFNKNLYVQCLQTRKIPNYDYNLNIIEEKITENECKSTVEIKRISTDSKVEIPTDLSSNIKQESNECFLADLSQITIENCLGDQFNRALNKYRCRRMKWKNRQDQWNNFLTKKPSKTTKSIEDQSIIEHARETIGHFRLKSSDDYRISSESALEKYKQLLQANEKLYEMRHNFNLKVYKLRKIKRKIHQELVDLTVKMREIQQDLDEEDRSDIPIIENLEDYECPEKNFEVNIKLNLLVDQNNIETKTRILPRMNLDQIERQILENCNNEFIDNRDVLDLDFDQLLESSSNDQLNTNWESELYQKRYKRKLNEQKQILSIIDTKIDEFNQKLIELNDESIIVQINSQFLNHFILILNQELVILSDYEQVKANLEDILREKSSELFDIKESISNCNEDIQKHQKNLEKFLEINKNIEVEFLQVVQENTTLKELFEKESGASRIDEDSEQVIEICPNDCDSAIYDFVLNLRSERYAIEAQIEEKSATIRLLKENIENYNGKLSVLEESIKATQEDLYRHEREKHEKLNEIKTIIILPLNQIKNLDEVQQASSIMDSLVFSKHELTKLYKRVDELEIETDQLKKAHFPKIYHLRRISADIKFMETNLQQLKSKMGKLIRNQLGFTIDIEQMQNNILNKNFDKDILTDLEEIVLKKYVHDLCLSDQDLGQIYTKELHLWKDNVKNLQKELKETLEENTRRHQLLKMLLKEKYELRKFVEQQNKKQEHLINIEMNMKENRKEIEKLEKIIEQQNNEIFELKNELKQLRTKGILPVRIPRKELPTIPTEPLEEIVLYEESIEKEEEEEEEGFSGYKFRLSSSAESVVRNLLKEMWENLNIKLSEKSQENFLKTILDNIFERFSVTEMLNEIINNLPVEIPEEKVSILEITAEKLLTLPDIQLTEEEDLENYCIEILEDLLDDIILIKEGPSEMISSFINRLVEQLPVDFIKKDTSMEMIAERFVELSINSEIDRNELKDRINNKIGHEIINEILENVYRKIDM